MKHTKKQKHREMTGAKLQRTRFMFGGSGSMKSQKVPLISKDTQYYTDLAEKIKTDYKDLTGALQLSDYVHDDQGKRYSVIAFLVDCWRAGMVFAPTAKQFADLLASLQGGRGFVDAISKTLQEQNTSHMYDAGGIVENIIKLGEVRANAGEAKRKKFEECFIPSYRDAHTQEVQDATTRWLESCRGKGQEQYQEFFQKELGITFPQLASDRTCTLWSALPFAPDISEEEIIERLRPHTDQKTKISSLLGLDNKQTGLSNFFTQILPIMQEGDETKLVEIFGGDFPTWQEGSDLRNRLQWLIERSKRIPKSPQLVGNWAPYRTQLGGSLESWLSNSLSRDNNWQTRMEENRVTLDQLLIDPLLSDTKRMSSEYIQRRKERLFESARDILEKSSPRLALAPSLHPFYNSLISEYSQILNEFITEFDTSDKEEKILKKYKKVKPFDKKWGFFGSAKLKKYRDFTNLMPRLQSNVPAVTQLLDYCTQNSHQAINLEEEQKRRCLQRYLGKRDILSSPRYTQSLIRSFESVSLSIQSFQQNQVIYSNKWGRRRQEIVPFDAKDVDLFAFISSFNLHKAPPIRKSHLYELFDWVELCKTSISLYASVLPDLEVSLSHLFLQSAEDQQDNAMADFAAAYGDKQKLSTIARLLQQEVLSRIRGDLSTMSLTQYVERSIVNFSNIDTAFLYMLKPKDSEQPLDRNNRNKWGIWERDNAGSDIALVFNDAKELSKLNPKKRAVNDDRVLYFSTSKYQIGWFDRLLPCGDKIPDMTYEVSAMSLVVETPYQIQWDERSPKASIERMGNETIYAVVPITPNPSRKSRTLWVPNRYIGIDVGEYGIAYSVIEKYGNKVVIKKSGFISEPELRKIADYVKTAKERQRRGTFSIQETLLQAYRVQAVKAIRNRIHDLIIRYQAPVVYEASISNFETGSARLTKIYHTLKIADTPDYDQQAEKAEARQTWGDKSNVRGTQVAAYNTSRTCLKCKKCYPAEIEDRCKDHKPMLEKSNEGNTLIRLGDLLFHVYGDTSKIGEEKDVQKKMTALAYGFARPPQEAGHISQLGLTDQHQSMRGNSAIFVCPLCLHISDADIQASVCVALKHAFRETKNKEQWTQFQKRDPSEKFRLWLDWLSDLDIVPIEFTQSEEPKAHAKILSP